ncbi:MAG: FAD-dependent oxidoreductase, partial [Candidatus Omnitrophica bacterium]|nr:FAD-dependent oxidoreductase [Candidatus Omnitrophota bacterium]
SGIITDALRQIGCNLFTNNTAIEIRAENRKQSKERRKAKEVVLKDKKRIPCDLVIVAVGVKPNIKLTKNTPIKTNKGILVDKFLQTNVKNVYAAGDCSEAMDTVLGANRVLAIWPVALRQGKLAGYNMSQGKKQQYLGGLAMNAVELCALPTISVGLTNLQEKNCQSVEVFDKAKSIYKKLVLKDNKIVGAILVGNIERAGIYTGLIKDKVDVSAFQDALLEKDFGLVYLPKEYRKHLVAREAAII